MKKKMLICGADGFIGKSALNFFNKTYDVTATIFNKLEPSRGILPDVEYVSVDLRNEEEVIRLFNRERFDVVLQCAATTTGAKDVVERPYVHVTDNAVMNSWILREAMKTEVGHLIFPSCTVMYQPDEKPQKESDWSASDELYPAYFGVGHMKVFCENMCDFYSRIGKTKYTAIRHSNVYGPRDKFDLGKCHVVPAFINKIEAAKEELEIWGSGRAARDVLYIDDLIEFFEKVINLQQNKYELFNCGAGSAVSILDLAKEIMKIENKDLNIVFDRSKPDIPTTVVLNCEKAEKELGWKPRKTLQEGLNLTYEWYKENAR